MNLNLILLIAGLVEITALYFYFARKKAYDLMLNTETLSISTVRKGLNEIKGKVEALEDTIISPYSNRPCVYYKFTVEQERSSGKNSSSWHTIIKDERYVRFAINDGSGKAVMNIKSAKLKFRKDVKERSGTFNNANSDMKRALQKYNESAEAWFFEKTLRYRETYVEEGETLYCIGDVVDYVENMPVFRKQNNPLIISDKSEESLLNDSKLIMRICMFFILAIPIAIALFATW